jgi:hypothetical protein
MSLTNCNDLSESDINCLSPDASSKISGMFDPNNPKDNAHEGLKKSMSVENYDWAYLWRDLPPARRTNRDNTLSLLARYQRCYFLLPPRAASLSRPKLWICDEVT